MRRGIPVPLLVCAIGMASSAHAQSPELSSGQASTAPPLGLPGTTGSIITGDRSASAPVRTTVPTEPTAYPAPASGLGPRAGYYYISRWAEDWSFLKDRPKSVKADLFDPLKFVPLADDGNVYLSLSGEERFRVNYTTRPGLKDKRDPDQELLRSVIGADLHLGDHVRVYGELASAQQWGTNASFASTSTTISPTYRNDLVVQQLFGEVRGKVLGAQMGVMAGRQEFQDGPPVIIGTRPAGNVYTVQNGVRFYANWKSARIDLFSFRSTRFGAGAFDDPVLDSERFKGIQASVLLARDRTPFGKARLYVDPFFYRYENDAKKWGATTGEERRNIYGARMWGSLGKLTLDITALRQDGRFAGRPISADGYFALAEYQFSDSGLKPRIGFHTDYASGGGAYGNGPLHTFNFLTGATPYFSWGFFIAPTNLRTFAPVVRINPTPSLRVSAEVEWLRRRDQSDAVYLYNGAYAGTQLVRGHDIGKLLRADAAWSLSRHLSATLYLERLVRGDVLRRANLNSSTYLGGALTFRF